MAFSMEEVLNFCVYGCAGLGVAVLVAVHLPYAGMDFPTYTVQIATHGSQPGETQRRSERLVSASRG